MTFRFSQAAQLSPERYLADIETGIGETIFDQWSLDPKRYQAQFVTATGANPFTAATALSPDLERAAVAAAINDL
jgi:hypothetical protein